MGQPRIGIAGLEDNPCTVRQQPGYDKQVSGERSMMDRMMDGMGGMIWAAGLLWLLLIIVLVLAAAALIKYLRSGGTR